MEFLIAATPFTTNLPGNTKIVFKRENVCTPDDALSWRNTYTNTEYSEMKSHTQRSHTETQTHTPTQDFDPKDDKHR